MGVNMKKNLIKTMTAAAAVCLLVSLTTFGILAEEEAAEPKTIGETAEGENVFSVKLVNKTEKGITGLAIKGSTEEGYPENMLEEGDVFEQDEERILYFDASEIIEAVQAENSTDENVPVTKPVYMMQVTFDDESVQVLHSFPFGDASEVALCRGEEVLYLTYMSLLGETEVSTEEAERMAKQLDETAQEQAEEVYHEPVLNLYGQPVGAPDTAAQEPAAAPDTTPVEEPVYEEPVYQEPVYQEPVYQEPVYQEPVYQEPVYQEPAPDPGLDYSQIQTGDGCVTDGLVY